MQGGCSRRPWGSSRPSPLRGPRWRSCACAAALARHSSVCARPRPAGTAGRGPHRLCALTAPAAPACAVGGVRWAQKPARPLRGSAAPPCALAAPSRAAAAAGGPSGRLPPSHFFSSGGGWLLPAHSAAVAPFAGLAAGSQGRGACSSRPVGRPLRAPPLQPRPPVLAPGRGYFVFAAAGIDIAPALTRGAISCGAIVR